MGEGRVGYGGLALDLIVSNPIVTSYLDYILFVSLDFTSKVIGYVLYL